MNYLLDTQIWIWSQTEPRKLGRRVQRVFTDVGNAHWLSPVSLVEFGILHNKQRFKIDQPSHTWLAKAMAGLHEAVVTNEVALASHRYLTTLRDPADRVIAATAAVYGLCLITADGEMTELKDIEVLSNQD